MPHIHTEPDQHDMTISAYVILVGQGEPKVFVHMHLKHHKLLQVGGHIELNETPWHAVARELAEESGFTMDELQVLQPDDQPVVVADAVVHPVPVLMNTHKISDDHYHSDLCYAFVTKRPPVHHADDGESTDIRWLTMAELRDQVKQGVAARDVATQYEHIIAHYLDTYARIPADHYSLDKPRDYSL